MNQIIVNRLEKDFTLYLKNIINQKEFLEKKSNEIIGTILWCNVWAVILIYLMAKEMKEKIAHGDYFALGLGVFLLVFLALGVDHMFKKRKLIKVLVQDKTDKVLGEKKTNMLYSLIIGNKNLNIYFNSFKQSNISNEMKKDLEFINNSDYKDQIENYNDVIKVIFKLNPEKFSVSSHNPRRIK